MTESEVSGDTHAALAKNSENEPKTEPGNYPVPVTIAETRPVPLLSRILTFFRPRQNSSLRDDLTDALSQDTGGYEAFSDDERAMLRNILRFRELRVEDVMIPRAAIEAIELDTTLGDLMTFFEKSGHSRLPVYGESLDDPRGMVHIRDVVAHIISVARTPSATSGKKRTKDTSHNRSELDLSRIELSRCIDELGLIRPILFVPPSMLASDLMARMQAMRTQMALVIDEYGGSDGLVSLEDIVEMVVGDIEDEHDEDEPMIVQSADGVFDVNAKIEIDDVAEVIGEAFHPGEHGEDVDTIGGMIFNALGRIPARGEVVQAVPGFEFRVLDADPRRIKRVRIVQTRTGERRRRHVRQNPGSNE